MTPFAIAGLLVIVTFGAAVFGLWLHTRLPDHHMDTFSREAIKSVMGLVATMAALLLGLLIHSAQVTTDTVRAELDAGAASLLELDRALTAYGPEAAPAQAFFREMVREQVTRLMSQAGVDPAHLGEDVRTRARVAFIAEIEALTPQTAAQRSIVTRVTTLLDAGGRARILLAQRAADAMPVAFLAVMAFWLTMLFLGFGLLAPRNATVLWAFLVGAVSVSAAMFLIMELSQPFEGLLRVPDTPLRNVLRQLAS